MGNRIGLVLEGGAMRGMFTCGVIDVLMENDIWFEAAAGISAGAVFGCNYKSRQIGRPIRYNKRHLDAELRVEVRERLVHQQHVRLDAERAGQGDALLLAAGEALGHAVGELVDLHELHELVGLFLDLLLRELLVLQAELHVLAHRVVREDGVVLEHHADVALESRVNFCSASGLKRNRFQ